MVYHDKTELIQKTVQKTDVVLDVGFYGQGVLETDPNWVHGILKKQAAEVWGVDLEFGVLPGPAAQYLKASAENFDFPVKFDVIFAGDLIEHLSNPGLFLDSCYRNLKDDGRLILTTPNCFNLYNLAEKLSKFEPTVNSDHTCYFNTKTLKKLLAKNKWATESADFLYTLEVNYAESWKKKFLNFLYSCLAKGTPKFLETIVVVARKEPST